MDEIVTKVAERTGVSADTVRQVLSSAADFLKQKLPPGMAGQLESYLQGPGGEGGQGGQGLGGMIGNLFGKG